MQYGQYKYILDVEKVKMVPPDPEKGAGKVKMALLLLKLMHFNAENILRTLPCLAHLLGGASGRWPSALT